MTNARIGFKRIVIALPQSTANQAAVDATANLAELLHVELLAAFLADTSLHALAGYPTVRELRTFDQRWHTIDAEQIARDIDYAAGAARRRFIETVRSRNIKSGFNVVTGPEAMSSLISPDDIVAIIEPAHPGERITRQFTDLCDAALETAGGVLVVPRRIAHATGPVVALTTRPEDAGSHAALAIAAALKERLILVTRFGTSPSARILSDANRLGVQVEQLAANGLTVEASSLALSSSRLNERLRVVTRGTLSNDAPRLFSILHGVPLLLVEPHQITHAATE